MAGSDFKNMTFFFKLLLFIFSRFHRNLKGPVAKTVHIGAPKVNVEYGKEREGERKEGETDEKF
jgi:hypothetical protein